MPLNTTSTAQGGRGQSEAAALLPHAGRNGPSMWEPINASSTTVAVPRAAGSLHGGKANPTSHMGRGPGHGRNGSPGSGKWAPATTKNIGRNVCGGSFKRNEQTHNGNKLNCCQNQKKNKEKERALHCAAGERETGIAQTSGKARQATLCENCG